MDNLIWLQEWYRRNCQNCEWHEYYGIKIDTLDNPGWIVKIDIAETPLMGKPFSKIEIDNGSSDWLFCKVENNVFEGVGDPLKLTLILKVFREWVEN